MGGAGARGGWGRAGGWLWLPSGCCFEAATAARSWLPTSRRCAVDAWGAVDVWGADGDSPDRAFLEWIDLGDLIESGRIAGAYRDASEPHGGSHEGDRLREDAHVFEDR